MAKTLVINDITYYTYADLEDAEIYNNAIYGSVCGSLTTLIQSQLLVQATRIIDSYKYTGEKLSPEQPLKFPRISSRGVVSDDNVLTDLCCQIALYIYQNGGASSGGATELLSGLKEYKLGDLQVNFKDNVSFDLGDVDDYIEKALGEWLISSSMEIWL